MKHRCSPTSRSLSMAIALACLALAAGAAQAQAPRAQSAPPHKDDAVELDRLEVREHRTRDEKAHDDVYDKSITNLYVDREYLDRYRGVSTGDVFAGMNGVYNTDNRNGSALFPNIRGLSGNGRIPVTVDGTVQSLDVWMAMRGINNRNYLDPNLFRSVEVEKGPSMTRGIKSGIGGSVAIRTIEASDLIAPGRNWGIEFKAGAGSNSVKNPLDPMSIVGKDYHDVDGAIISMPYGTPGVSFTKPLQPSRDRRDVSRFNLDDRRLFLAAGYRTERFDLMAAYSDSKRGNYFAGKHGADKYMYNATPEGTGLQLYDRTTSRNMYPNIGRLFAPRYEVPFTDVNTESLLLKNTWYLPGEQKLSLGYTRNRQQFGELPAASLEMLMGLLDQDAGMDLARGLFGYPFPATVIDQDVYRIGYEAKPAGSAWLDLEVGLWRTVNRSTRYQTGDTTYQTKAWDRAWDEWVLCNSPAYLNDEICQMMVESGYIYPPDQRPPRLPNTDGQFDIFVGTRQDTRSTRNGFDISNRFRLGDRLALTATADWQREGQRDHVPVETTAMVGGVTTVYLGPASGRRQEYGVGLNLDWKPSERLQVSAGVRYGHYTSFDEETEHRRADRHWRWRDDQHNVSMPLQWKELVSDEVAFAEDQLYEDAHPTRVQDPVTGNWYQPPPFYKLSQAEREHYTQVVNDYRAPRCGDIDAFTCSVRRDWINGFYYLQGAPTNAVEVPLHGRKADRHQNPFYTGRLDAYETVQNPQGKQGTYLRYQPFIPGDFTSVKPADPWPRPEEQRLGAWSSQLVVSYRLFERARVYGRLGSMARFPSLMESADRHGLEGSFDFTLHRPERNLAWEVGYAHDLGGLLPGLPQADLKLSYYHNSIRNFFDRTNDMATIQFDRKEMSGLELQGRFDSGLLHGSLGISRRLRQKMCDKDYAVMLDPFYQRLPECITGGFPYSLSWFALQPRTSINLELGTRLLDARLQLGARLRYHSGTENRQLDRLLAADANWQELGYTQSLRGVLLGSTPYSWEPVRLVDLYAEFHFNRHASARLSVDNLTDRYYLDPLGKIATPGPGRTLMLDLAFKL